MNEEKKLTFDILFDAVKAYNNDLKDLELIRRAYMYAYEVHFGEKRLNGDDYIIHPLNVANILTSVKADAVTLSAGLLHDVLEKDESLYEDIKDKFGDEVASLVQGVTKINQLKLDGMKNATIANYRKIIVGITEDVRAIIIKLADRLHNMRTLYAISETSQKEKAKETLDILTPIAERLGINVYKSELEDLSLRYYKPDIYFQIVEELNQTKSERENSLIEMKMRVCNLLDEHKIKYDIKGRVKSVYSIYKKLNKGKKISEIYDILALRVYVETESECYQVLGLIHHAFKPLSKRFKDYIAMPKTNMYQSLHTTIFGVGGNLYEIQIRTYKMDEVAENGIASHWSYKERGSNVKADMQNDMEQKLQFFKSIIELSNSDANDEDFIEHVKKDVFKHTIYVYTPNGDVIELPRGSTPIDFAYKIHSNIGDTMVGAIVNGVIVPLDTELKDYDIVKINTNKNSTPKREWLNIAITAQAKNKIKGYFSKIDKDEYLKIGSEMLLKELRRKKIVINDFFTTENINKIVTELKYKSIDDIYSAIGSNKIPVTAVINIIYNDNETKEDIILKRTQNKEVKVMTSKNDVLIAGVDNIKINLASCCMPVYGDKIIGYITKGNGVSVHRMVCPNVAELDERVISVNWNEDVSHNFNTTIRVETDNLDDVLLSIISKTSNTSISIISVNTMKSDNRNIYEIVISVDNIDSLAKFIDNLMTIPSVVKAERSIK